MRREDRARDAAFAWAVFDRAACGVLSLRDGEGGYGVPISPARIGSWLMPSSRFRSTSSPYRSASDAGRKS